MDPISILRSMQKVGDWIKEEEIKMFFSSVYGILCTSAKFDSGDEGVSMKNFSSSGSWGERNLHGKECESFIKMKFLKFLSSPPYQYQQHGEYYQKSHEFFVTGDQIDSFIFVSFLWFLIFIVLAVHMCS